MKNKILTILLSAVIAIGLWVYVVTVVSPDSERTYYNIPVVLQNENALAEKGLMITSKLPAVTLTLSGNRMDLNTLNENNINILVNVATIEVPGNHQLLYSVSYPGSIPQNAIERKGSSVSAISIRVENKITKQVPVVLDYKGSVPEGFLADKENPILDYSTIEVSGPEPVVKQISQAKIGIDLNKKSETIVGQFVYDLCNAAGDPVDVAQVTTNVEAVNLTVKIQRVKEIELKVVAKPGGGATEFTTQITIEPAKIRVSGSDVLLEKLDALELGEINLGDMTSSSTATFPITLPEGVTNITGITEAKVTVRFPNLGMKKLTVRQINVVNVPVGMEVDMITEALELVVRGPKTLIDSITDMDIIVTVDCTNAQLGAATMKANVTFTPQFGSFGVVGSCNVSAILREATQNTTVDD